MNYISEISKTQFELLEALYENNIIHEENKISNLEMVSRFQLNRKTFQNNREFLVNKGLLVEYKDKKTKQTWRKYTISNFGIFVYLRYLADRVQSKEGVFGITLLDKKFEKKIQLAMKYFPLMKQNNTKVFFTMLYYVNYYLDDIPNSKSITLEIQFGTPEGSVTLKKIIGTNNNYQQQINDILTFCFYDYWISALQRISLDGIIPEKLLENAPDAIIKQQEKKKQEYKETQEIIKKILELIQKNPKTKEAVSKIANDMKSQIEEIKSHLKRY